jgi:hypothetical protein
MDVGIKIQQMQYYQLQQKFGDRLSKVKSYCVKNKAGSKGAPREELVETDKMQLCR